MIIYRVSYYTESDSSCGFTFHTSKRTAEKEFEKFKKEQISNHENFDDTRSCIDAFEFDLTKKGVIQLLGVVAEHPDNG